MAEDPTTKDFWQFLNYLHRCESAAIAPPPPAPPKAGLLGLFAPPSTGSGPLASTCPRTFTEVLGVQTPSTHAAEELPPTRDGRIAMLSVWMERLPAHRWLVSQPAVVSALTSFRRVQKRNQGNAKYSDDLAIFRFWRCAALAADFRNARHLPSADADQRTVAESAARRLIQIAESTRLLGDIGMNWQQASDFRTSLYSLLSVSKIKRRRRVDTHSDDRKFIELLAEFFWQNFDAVPPSPIVSLAALKLRNPDSVSITKMVKARAKELAAKSA